MVETNLKPRDYVENEVVRIVNRKQHELYVKHRVFPIDMYPSIDGNGNPIVVYIYLKEDTKELHQLWMNYELE